MLPALIIVFREVIEAGLVIGIVLATARGVHGGVAWVGLGVLGRRRRRLSGGRLRRRARRGLRRIRAGPVQRRRPDRSRANARLAQRVDGAARTRHRGRGEGGRRCGRCGTPTMTALAVVVGIAVLREGAEGVLFLYGIAVSAARRSPPWRLAVRSACCSAAPSPR